MRFPRIKEVVGFAERTLSTIRSLNRTLRHQSPKAMRTISATIARSDLSPWRSLRANPEQADANLRPTDKDALERILCEAERQVIQGRNASSASTVLSLNGSAGITRSRKIFFISLKDQAIYIKRRDRLRRGLNDAVT